MSRRSMIGVPGVAQRLFGSLHRMGISVILISQASSEHSISVAIDSKHAAVALVSRFDPGLLIAEPVLTFSPIDVLCNCSSIVCR
jgi:hypothetical protein